MNAPRFFDLWKDAFARGAQWRYLVLFVLGTLLPAFIVLVPVHGFFAALFDHSTRQGELVSSLDSSALFEVLRQLDAPEGPKLGGAMLGALVVALLVGPALAGAAAGAVQRDDAPRARELLAAVGSYYPRMLRMAVVSLLPLGVASLLAAGVLKMAGRSEAHAVLESSASRASALSWLAVVVLVWLGHSTAEVGRAVLVAEPERKSALLAWWSGVRFLGRHGPRVLGLCLVTTLAALVLAAALTAVRLRLGVGGPVTIALEFLVAQAAIAAVGWGRASRLAGLVQMLQTPD